MRDNHSPFLRQCIFMIAMVVSYAMVFIDESGIAVTLPKMQQELTLTNNVIHWIINSYLLTLAVLLLLGGKLSDIYGRRRIFMLGVGIFALFSMMCALAQNGWLLILGRMGQGIGASLLMPCTAVLIKQHFSDNDFGKFFGVILGFANFFYAVGPFIGGVLTQFFNWRFFFWINIPLSILCISFIALAVPPDVISSPLPFSDKKGLFIFILTVSAFVFALMQGGAVGWDNKWIIACLVFAVFGFLLFIQVELQAKEALLDIRLFANKDFLAGNVILFCSAAALTSLVFLALWLQKNLHFSPTSVGLALLPATSTFIFIPSLSGAWRDKSGPRPPMLWGTVLMVIGIAWIAATVSLQSYAWLVLGLMAFGCGIPLTIPNCYTTAITSVDSTQIGMASGTLATIRELGLSIGIAVMSAMIYTVGFRGGMMVMSIVAVIALLFTICCITTKRAVKQTL